MGRYICLFFLIEREDGEMIKVSLESSFNRADWKNISIIKINDNLLNMLKRHWYFYIQCLI